MAAGLCHFSATCVCVFVYALFLVRLVFCEVRIFCCVRKWISDVIKTSWYARAFRPDVGNQSHRTEQHTKCEFVNAQEDQFDRK